MKYAVERLLARSLLATGRMTVTDIAQASGVYRQTAAQWSAGIDAKVSRRTYLSAAWSDLSLAGESEGKSDQDLACEIMRAGLALPIELAPLVNRDPQSVRLWARAEGIDPKATRRAAAAALWRAAVSKNAAEQAEYRRCYDEYKAGNPYGLVWTNEGDFYYPDEFATFSESERERLTKRIYVKK